MFGVRVCKSHCHDDSHVRGGKPIFFNRDTNAANNILGLLFYALQFGGARATVFEREHKMRDKQTAYIVNRCVNGRPRNAEHNSSAEARNADAVGWMK